MKHLTHTFISLFRAIEVAKVGNHSVSVHFYPDYTNGFKDYRLVKEFCKDWFTNFVSDGDIKVEIHDPGFRETNSKRNYETLEDIEARVVLAKKRTLESKEVNEAGKTLLKVATEKLKLSLSDVEKCEKVAGSIALLADSKDLKIEHLAEAIHYCKSCEEGINAENQYNTFGTKIRIEHGDIDKESAEKAIQYLSKYLI